MNPSPRSFPVWYKWCFWMFLVFVCLVHVPDGRRSHLNYAHAVTIKGNLLENSFCLLSLQKKQPAARFNKTSASFCCLCIRTFWLLTTIRPRKHSRVWWVYYILVAGDALSFKWSGGIICAILIFSIVNMYMPWICQSNVSFMDSFVIMEM